MVADSVRVPQPARASGCCSTPSTSSTAEGATPSSACGCSRPRPSTAPRRSCCATPTAGRCPTRSRRIVREISRHFRDDVKIGVHLHDDTGCGVANALAGVRGGAVQVQGTINGYGERTGNCNLTTIIPNLTLKMGVRHAARGPPRAAHRGRPPHRRAREHHAEPAAARTSARRRSPTRPACTCRAIARRKDAYEHVDPDAVGNGTRFVVSEMAGKATLELKAAELGLELDGAGAHRGHRRAQAARARGLPLRGGRRLARAADAPGRRLATGRSSRSSRSG